jgi:hypothetical protein
MSLNVGGLTAYVDENKMALIKKMVLGGRTIRYINVQPDIKSTATVNIINSSLTAAAGTCGWDEAGTTILTQQDLSVCPLKVNESICLNTLETYYTQKMMNPGSYNKDIPFEEIYVEEKASQLSALVDDLIWKGNTSASGNMSLCNGFIALATGATFSGSVVNVVSGTPTSATVVAIVDSIVAAIPSDILDQEDLVIFCGYDFYRLYALALRNANLFHYTGAENQGEDFTQMVPGTNVRIIAVRGLNGSNKAFASSASNFYFGTDLLSDFEVFELWYSLDNGEVRFRANWKQGVVWAFPSFVVYYR